ncbi:PTIP-associated protein 1 [Trinorchestia longiramus]|nr:PTIP-associated protein 1 [Trinorchestia longiramus]
MHTNSLQQHVNEPTRGNNILDLVMTTTDLSINGLEVTDKIEKTMSGDDWAVDCSDEEIDNAFEEDASGNCMPVSTQEIVQACSIVPRARAGEAVLEWKSVCGRRPPTPQSVSDSPSEDEEIANTHVDTSGFDFSDDSSAVRLAPRRAPGTSALKGSAKKKTTSFENILASVRRQKKLEATEKTSPRFKK